MNKSYLSITEINSSYMHLTKVIDKLRFSCGNLFTIAFCFIAFYELPKKLFRSLDRHLTPNTS